jgi:hypothetical protein
VYVVVFTILVPGRFSNKRWFFKVWTCVHTWVQASQQSRYMPTKVNSSRTVSLVFLNRFEKSSCFYRNQESNQIYFFKLIPNRWIFWVLIYFLSYHSATETQHLPMKGHFIPRKIEIRTHGLLKAQGSDHNAWQNTSSVIRLVFF